MQLDGTDRSTMGLGAGAAQSVPECESHCRSPGASSIDAGGAAETAPGPSTTDAPLVEAAPPPSQAALRWLDDEELIQAWSQLGTPDEYEEPTQYELECLNESRRRKRGKKMRLERLQRQNQKLRRHLAACACVCWACNLS